MACSVISTSAKCNIGEHKQLGHSCKSQRVTKILSMPLEPTRVTLHELKWRWAQTLQSESPHNHKVVLNDLHKLQASRWKQPSRVTRESPEQQSPSAITYIPWFNNNTIILVVDNMLVDNTYRNKQKHATKTSKIGKQQTKERNNFQISKLHLEKSFLHGLFCNINMS